MWRRTVALALTVALVLGGVGLGIHLLHREALAQVAYIVTIKWTDDIEQPEFDPLIGADVEMNFKSNGGWSGWLQATDLEDGRYKVQRQEEADEWKVRIVDPDIVPLNPNTNPCYGPATAYTFEWFVFWD